MVPLGLKRLGRRVSLRSPSRLASLLVRMRDGRSIAVEEFGDPASPTVLYFHGWPASRLEPGLIPNLPVRLLAFDRPGYGRSSPLPGRTLLDWPRDVAEVADRLGLDQFYLIGLSGGGPFAAATAYALPGRVRALCLISPVPPASAISRRASGVGHLFRLGRHPAVARRVLGAMRPLLQRRIITPRTFIGSGLPGADRECLAPSTVAGLGRAWREGLRRGILGAVSDAEIYADPWGFDPVNIKVPTSIWIGADDSLIPRESLAPYAAIPGARLHVVPGEGHYSLALRHAAQMLGELTEA